MMTMNDDLDLLRDLRPDTRTLEREWPSADRDVTLRAVLADDSASPVRFRSRIPGRSVRRAALPAAAAAVAAMIAGLLIAVMPGGGHDEGSAGPHGDRYTATTVVPTARVGVNQFAYRATVAYETKKGHLEASQRTEDWVSPDGTVWSKRSNANGSGSQCYVFRDGGTKQRVLDRLPTTPDALDRKLRADVSGSTSRDEAVFVFVGDTLRGGGLLASSRLRAAFVEVLSRTGGVAVHADAVDSRGRAAIRVDFVDRNNRPGEIASLFFARGTYQLLEEASGRTAPTPYESQSYDRAPAKPTTAAVLPTPTSLVSTTQERVVDTLPVSLLNCPNG